MDSDQALQFVAVGVVAAITGAACATQQSAEQSSNSRASSPADVAAAIDTTGAPQRVLVTGGANGIGRGIVDRFLEDGASVVFVDLVAGAVEQIPILAGRDCPAFLVGPMRTVLMRLIARRGDVTVLRSVWMGWMDALLSFDEVIKGAYGTLGDLAGALHAHIDMAGLMEHFKFCRSSLETEGLPRHAVSGMQKSKQDSVLVGSKLYIWGPPSRTSGKTSGILSDAPVTVLRVFPADRVDQSRKVVLLEQDGASGTTQLVPLDVCVQRLVAGRGRGQRGGSRSTTVRHVNSQFARPRRVTARNMDFV